MGGSLAKINIFGTEHFVRYSRHDRYLGCPLLGGFTVDTTCFDECFLFYLIIGSHCVCKSLSLLFKDFFSRHIVAFFELSVLIEVRISTVSVQC